MSDNIIILLKIIPAMIASIMLGNAFLSEVTKNRVTGGPWYKPYISPPGLLVITACIVVPLVLWKVKQP